MNRRFVISFFIFVLLIINNLYAAPKNYVDEEKGYNLLTEIDFISEKMSEKDKNEYSQQLYDWCNEVGNNARILKKLPKDIEWGLQKGLSEFSIKSGETYVARITRIEQKNSKFFFL